MIPAELRSIGKCLYGDGWEDKMALVLPCTKRAIYYWLSGKRKISPLVEARIRSLKKEK